MKKTAIPKRLAKPIGPDAAEREYYKFLNHYVETYARLLRKELEAIVPHMNKQANKDTPDSFKYDSARMDANIEKSTRNIFASVQRKLMKLFPDSLLKRWANAMVGHVNTIGKRNIIKTVAPLDIEIEPLLKDKELNPYFKNVIEENVGLIKSIPLKKMPELKNSIVYALTHDYRAEEIEDTINSLLKKNMTHAKNSARLIARDQVGKLIGKVDQYRQTTLGVKRYRWIGANDSRERPDHKELNNKIFSWDKPPIINKATGKRGHPGEDFQCRCYAEPILEDIID